jgi:hypothetical protein
VRAMRITIAAGTILAALVSVASLRAQRASPHDSVSASIGGADISISYGRPYMRGRTIFGALVPYGRVWCPGADEATTLSSSKPLAIGNLLLDAPQYTLWILPTADEWQLVVNNQTGQWHTQYRASADLGRVPLQKRTLDTPVEQLTFALRKNPDGSGGTIVFTWATTEASVPFTVVTRPESR